MEYTEEQKEYHYRYLVQTIQFLLNKERITEDWMEEHKKSIMKYRREFMDDLKYMNVEITNLGFRQACTDADPLLNKLVNSIIKKGTFDVNTYLIFCQKIKFIVDFVSNYYPEASLENLVAQMKI
jgi:hypothetical protein